MSGRYADIQMGEILVLDPRADTCCQIRPLLHDQDMYGRLFGEMVRGRAETVEAKERELEEEEAILKAMQRGELPQGDE